VNGTFELRSDLPGRLLSAALILLFVLFARAWAATAPLHSAPHMVLPGAVAHSPSETRIRRFDHHSRVTGLWYRLLTDARAAGWQGHVKGPRSALRNHDQQRELWLLYKHGQGAPAFRPRGPSRHLTRNVRQIGPWAQAVDVTHPRQLIRIAGRWGVELVRPHMPLETWHVEAAGPFSISQLPVPPRKRGR
jgi:hypothetical protein